MKKKLLIALAILIIGIGGFYVLRTKSTFFKGKFGDYQQGMLQQEIVQTQINFPNLFVESVSWNSTTLAPTVVVKNYIGGNDVTATFTTKGIWQNSSGQDIGSSFSDAHSSLARDAVYTIQWPLATPPTGATQFKITVDAFNSVFESDENDNVRIEPFPKPDLAIQLITFDLNGAATIIVKNKGPVMSPANSLAANWFNTAQTPLQTKNKQIQILSIQPNQTATVTTEQAPDNTATVNIKVDSGLAVNESDENNNEWTGTLPRPDLIVESVDLSGAPANFRPMVRVQNIGITASPSLNEAPENCGVAINWLDNNNIIKGTKCLSLESLQPSVIQSGNNTYSATISNLAEVKKVWVTVDPSNHIKELNNLNNKWEGPIPLPDFAIDQNSIDFRSDHLTFTFKNEGTAATDVNKPTIKIKFQWLRDNGQVINQKLSKDIYAYMQPGTSLPFYSNDSLSISAGLDKYLTNPPSTAAKLNIILDAENKQYEIYEGINNSYIINRP